MSTLRATHACAACPGLARERQLMCRSCWSGVPKPLQIDVYRSWRAFQRRKNPSEGRAHLAAYQAACNAAVASLQRRPSKQNGD